MLKTCGFPEPADDVLVMLCGPKGMTDSAVAILEKAGYVKGEHYY